MSAFFTQNVYFSKHPTQVAKHVQNHLPLESGSLAMKEKVGLFSYVQTLYFWT